MPAVTRVLPWRRRPKAAVGETSALITEFHQRHPDADTALIEQAYRVALAAHEGQTRKSGDHTSITPCRWPPSWPARA